MKYTAPVLALIGAAAAAASQNVTVTNYAYVGVNGYPSMHFDISVDGISCAADHFVPATPYKCTNPAWTFTIMEGAGNGNNFTLKHTVDDKSASANFWIPINGPLFTVLEQVGLGESRVLVDDA
ncbi:hypothetical protein GMOD_00008176 [Pyrenophora seminiperda CCB06]|uniref:Uncharacterized protein n=1 Tax=Pyrenophora seminiperda CCB06 TaxID=1302712 RepID=A0A3M7M251_9PLEO|nr:hypothetical protein GMOD_00008176 [Pyrenophora seminiperda CCB06]